MCLILLCGMLTGTGPATAAEVDVRQASMTVDERTFEFGAYQVDLSANGRYAVFTSSVRTSTGGSAELEQHVYVRDVRTGRTELVSVASDGTPANDGSDSPSISADGRFVVFTSTATNLDDAAAGGGFVDVYVHDRVLGRTSQVSVDDTGLPGDANSFLPVISNDGHHVVFQSHAENLVPDDTNGKRDVFVRDLVSGTTRRASLSSGEQEGHGTTRGNDISADGRLVVFGTSSRLVPHERAGLFVRDMRRGTTRTICRNRDGQNPRAYFPHISGDGRHVSFGSDDSELVRADRNEAADVFVCDLESGRIRRVSVRDSGRELPGGSLGAGSISDNGRFVTFTAGKATKEDRTRGEDVYRRDVRRGLTRLVSVRSDGGQVRDGSAGGASSEGHAISANGRFVAWEAQGRGWTPTDRYRGNDVFWRDLRS